MPSSPITALIDQLPMELRAIQSDPAALWDVFSALPDPRNPRGVRHQFTGVLVIALCAVLAGARSFDAIAEWAADGAATVLAALGIGVPHSATIRRVLCRTDADAFDQAIGTWVTAQTGPKVIALDGKEVRGAKHGNGTRVHLMSALDHESRTVLGQVDVAQKTNEIPMFSTLLDTIKDLEEVIVTADAMHAQRAHATYLHGRGAHYVLTVKGNQKSLQRQLRSLPWGQVPTGDTAHFRGHGRTGTRKIKAVSVQAGLAFPHAAQAIEVTRCSRKLGEKKRTTETVYAMTDLPAGQASPAQINTWIRGHWAIENSLHWTRDVTFAEDMSQARTGQGPRMMASMRNLAISLYRLNGVNNIAKALRATARNPHRALKIAGISAPRTTLQ